MQHHRLLGDRGPQPLDLLAALAKAAASGLCPGRPGTEDASASSAPCLAVRTMCTTVERSTPCRSAASRWVNCPVSNPT